jgi:hypothetical protein
VFLAQDLSSRAKNILREYMVNSGDEGMWLVWCTNFDKVFFEKSYEKTC